VVDASSNRSARQVVGATVVFVVVAIGVVIDQLVKQWAIAFLSHGEVIEIVPTFSLQLVFNPGVAFGLGSGLGPITTVVLLLVLVALAGWIGVLVWRGRDVVDVILLSVVLAGGLGNVVDRVFRAHAGQPLTGHVVDYFSVSWFAIFNLADVFVVGGILAWVVVFMLRSNRRSSV
jgi:signal peptidase II